MHEADSKIVRSLKAMTVKTTGDKISNELWSITSQLDATRRSFVSTSVDLSTLLFKPRVVRERLCRCD